MGVAAGIDVALHELLPSRLPVKKCLLVVWEKEG